VTDRENEPDSTGAQPAAGDDSANRRLEQQPEAAAQTGLPQLPPGARLLTADEAIELIITGEHPDAAISKPAPLRRAQQHAAQRHRRRLPDAGRSARLQPHPAAVAIDLTRAVPSERCPVLVSPGSGRRVPFRPTIAGGPDPMTQRLWFRLDDVVPLAEHAMHCLSHEPAAG
jgi:pyruvate/2-oxoglutarate dehydrogenase complex dihydrolipoamide acyltransferase (E2) component